MTITKMSESEAMVVHVVKPQLATLEKIWPTEMHAFDPERFEKQVKLAFTKLPALLACDRATIIESLVQCAELGLDPSGTLGSAYLVPYGPKCQLIIGYRGLRDLAHRTGAVKAANAYVVYEKDAFKYEAGSKPRHTPYIPGSTEDQEPGAVRAAWAYVTLTSGGGTQETVMTLRDLEKIRARSKAKRGPWSNSDDVPEMYRKTVLRRALKYVPMSPNRASTLLERAYTIDDTAETVDAEAATDEQETAQSAGNGTSRAGASRTAAKLGISNRINEEGQA